MVVLHIILRNYSPVGYTLFAQKIRGDGLLKKCIPHVFLIRQNKFNGGVKPAFTSSGSLTTVSLQPLADTLKQRFYMAIKL